MAALFWYEKEQVLHIEDFVPQTACRHAGGSQVALLAASAVIVAISMAFYGVSWDTLENAVLDNIRSIGTAILILLFIGAIASHTVFSISSLR